MPDEKVLDRLAKLMAMGESPNEHEATLAGQRAAELMAKHQLTMADLMAHVKQSDITVETGRVDDEDAAPMSKRRELWMEVLLTGIVTAVGGKSWKHTRAKNYTFWMVGPPDAVSSARYLYMMLERVVGRIARKEMKDRAESNSFRRAYATGIAQRIGVRLQEQRRSTMDAGTSTALVFVGQQQAAVEKYYAAKNMKTGRGGHTQTPNAIGEGWVRGGSVDIGSSARDTLSAPKKELK